MDFTILAVVLLIGVGVPVRNKLIRKYREEKKKQDKMPDLPNDNTKRMRGNHYIHTDRNRHHSATESYMRKHNKKQTSVIIISRKNACIF